MKNCSHCAEAIQDDAVICEYCGMNAFTDTSPKLSTWIWVVMVVIGVPLVFLFILLLEGVITGDYHNWNNFMIVFDYVIHGFK